MTEPHPWDGFYAGAHVGYAFGKSSYQIAWPGGSTGGSIGVNAEDGQFGPLVGGLQMGYNYVSGSGLMIGVEGEFSVPDPMRGIARVARPSLGSLLIEDQVDAVGSLRGRVGQAVGAWLFYGTAGVAFSHDVATATNTAGDIDTRSLWRRGWVAGVGAEVWLSTNWSTRFEYSRLNFARDRISTHDSAYISDLTSQIFQVGMNYHFGPEVTKPRAGIVPDLNDWSIHGQSTTVAMTNAPFRAAYSGPGSLSNRWQTRETFSMSGYLGYRLSEGTEIYFNPESFQGFGLSGTHGIAGFPNNEAQKNGRDFPYYTRFTS